MSINLRILILIVLLAASPAAAQLSVITTTPDLADIATRIGGDAVTAVSLTSGTEDLHLVRAKPSLLVKLRRADVFIELGLDAEHAWVPALMRTARNDKIAPGAAGFVNCSVGVQPLKVPTDATRGAGPDVHPSGNPHYNLGPANARVIARNIRDGLSRASPDQAELFRKNAETFVAELDSRIEAWRKILEPFKGAAFIEYHDSWAYFADGFGLKIAAQLEPKPGVAPGARYLADVIRQAREQNVGLVVSRPAFVDVARKVADGIDCKAVVLPLSSTTSGEYEGYLNFISKVVDVFAENLRK